MTTSAETATGTEESRDRLRGRLGVSMDTIRSFCERWQVGKLALFGSVLRDDFGPDSDIDVLIEFDSERTPGLFGAVRMERELANLFGRNVDLVTRGAIENSRNYIRRRSILESAQVVYAAR